jgi:hypothetical protein
VPENVEIEPTARFIVITSGKMTLRGRPRLPPVQVNPSLSVKLNELVAARLPPLSVSRWIVMF